MGFDDIFKSNFLNNLHAVTMFDMILAVILAFVMGCFIFLVYHRTFRGVLYSEAFGLTLVALTAITTVLMMAVTSNVLLSLGMVGALSIVRFRTAIKDPMEIVFLFWAIEAGIVLAAGILDLAIIGNVLVGFGFLILVNRKGNRKNYILVLRCKKNDKEVLSRVKDCLKAHAYCYRETAVTPTAVDGFGSAEIEVNYEICLVETMRLKKNGTEPTKYDATTMYNELSSLGANVMIASFSGSYTRG